MRLIDADALKAIAIEKSEKCGDYYNELDKVLSAYDIERAPTIEEQRWIPTKGNKPPEDKEMKLVTCCTKKGQRSVNRAYYADGCWHGSGSMAGVTAWMPMPEPYKEDEP